MLPKPPSLASLPPIPFGAPQLPYEPLELGKNYWLAENALPNAHELVERCLSHKHWNLGLPYTKETWPGMRIYNALRDDERLALEAKVMALTGAKRLWVPEMPSGLKLDSNVAQLVGKNESGPRPHTDSRLLCRYAAVIYLNPDPPPGSGTSFCRLRYPNGAIGGNHVAAPHANLVDALKVRGLPMEAWYEDLRVENVFNRLILYKANFVHSATGYFGEAMPDRRLTLVFFWMCDD